MGKGYGHLVCRSMTEDPILAKQVAPEVITEHPMWRWLPVHLEPAPNPQHRQHGNSGVVFRVATFPNKAI